MISSEDDLREYLFGELSVAIHFSRLEAHASAPGIPDLAYTLQGVNGFLELKYGDKKRAPKVRPTQYAWMRQNVRFGGGNPLILVAIRGSEATKFRLIHGSYIELLTQNPGVKPWLTTPAQEWTDQICWPEFLATLFRPQNLLVNLQGAKSTTRVKTGGT
jgi:hypothetical protein